ncbi:hypothetical protein D3C72_1943150 [compost metagenome]
MWINDFKDFVDTSREFFVGIAQCGDNGGHAHADLVDIRFIHVEYCPDVFGVGDIKDIVAAVTTQLHIFIDVFLNDISINRGYNGVNIACTNVVNLTDGL